MDINEQKQPIPVRVVAPLSFKIFATIFLLIGLGMLPQILALFIFNPVLSIIPFGLFLLNEKTAIDLFKLKGNAVRNFYITIILDAFFWGFRFPIILGALASNSLIFALGISFITALIVIVPFLIVTRNKIPLPSTNPGRDNRIIFVLVVALLIASGIYSSMQNRQERKTIDDILNAEKTDKVTSQLTPQKKLASERCQVLLNAEFIQKTCGLTTSVFSHQKYNNDRYCNLVTKKENGPEFPDIGLEKGETHVAQLLYKLSSDDYDDYRNQVAQNLKFYPDAKIVEYTETDGESFSYSKNNEATFIFRPTEKDFSIRLSSDECNADALKIIGREIINNL
ncbi:hypothetical protein HYW83_02400 [Candidatus Peregrinibacteria bacterium]|nr:hypothetical protein [Candidatus Peregrinibacteria bacterium]